METVRVLLYLVVKSPSVCPSSSGVLRLRSVWRLQPGLLYDSGPKQPAQLVEVHTLPSSFSSLSSTLANTGSQNPPSMSCQPSDNQKRTKSTTNQPSEAVNSNDFTFLLELQPCCISAPGPPVTQRQPVKSRSHRPLKCPKWWHQWWINIWKKVKHKLNVNLGKGGKLLFASLSVFLVLIRLR